MKVKISVFTMVDLYDKSTLDNTAFQLRGIFKSHIKRLYDNGMINTQKALNCVEFPKIVLDRIGFFVYCDIKNEYIGSVQELLFFSKDKTRNKCINH